MRKLTFARYTADAGTSAPPVGRWHAGYAGIPADVDAAHAITSAGFVEGRPEDARTGLLDAPWNHTGALEHPRHALVLTTGTDFLPGDLFAVSIEPATPPA